MKAFIKIIFIFASTFSVFTACNVLNTGSQETVNQRFAREQREMQAQQQAEQARASQTLAAQYAGGQPGKISVKGAAVMTEGIHTLLDQRIKITQRTGQSDKSKLAHPTAIDAAVLPSFSGKIDPQLTESLIQDKTYVAFGCSQLLDAKLTQGLKEKSVSELTKHTTVLSAHTVFICGKIKLDSVWTTILAQELVLTNSSAVLKGSSGQLSLRAGRLILSGKNKIQTQGLNAAREVPTAPSLELTVLSAIDGDGSLELSSVGGNCSSN